MGLGKTASNIVFKFIGDAKSLQRASKASGRSLGTLDKRVSGTTKRLGLMQKAAGKLGAVMLAGALFQGFKSALARAEEMDSKYAITAKIIEDTGGAANLTADQVKDMAKEMSLVTGIDKSVITDAGNVLLTFKKIRDVVGEGNDVFSRSLELTGDMATVFGGSASDAAKTLGKALQDPIAGLTALRRVGVTFTDDQKAVIKAMVETGDVLGAQKVILGELESQIGGTAAASADATAIMGNAFQEVQEVIGNELLPEIKDLAPAIVDMAGDAAPAIKLLAGEIGDLLGGVSGLAAGLSQLNDDTLSTSEQMGGFEKANKSVLRILEMLGPNVLSVAEALEKNKDEAAAAETAALGLSFQMSDLADTTAKYRNTADDATDAVARLADEQRAMVDPVFRMKRAEEKLLDTLANVRKDGVITADELDDLAQAHLDVQAATEAVTPEAMSEYKKVIQDVRENVVNDAALIEKAIGTVGSDDNLAEVKGFLTRLEELTGRTITIDLSGIRIASQADIEQAVQRALWAAQRRGATGNVFL